MKKDVLIFSLGLLTWAGALSHVLAQNTAFTYQGRLTDGVNLANGSYDLTFALFTSSKP